MASQENSVEHTTEDRDAAHALLKLYHDVHPPDESIHSRIRAFLARYTPPENPIPSLDNLEIRDLATAEELEQIYGERVNVILVHWMALNDLVNRHEARIRHRWHKISGTRRKRMLLETIPNLPLHHRPEREFLVNELRPSQIIRDKKTLNASILPSWNLEDLAKPKNFLLMLNARARNVPSVFAMHDLCSISSPNMLGCFGPSWLSNKCVAFSVEDFPERYGHLLFPGRESDRGSRWDWVHGLEGREAALVLEIQSKMLGNLFQLARALLSNVPDSELLNNATYPVQPEPPAIAIELETLVKAPMLLAENMEQPYRCPVPAGVDFAWLEKLFRAAYCHVRDEFWLLREVCTSHFESHKISARWSY